MEEGGKETLIRKGKKERKERDELGPSYIYSKVQKKKTKGKGEVGDRQ